MNSKIKLSDENEKDKNLKNKILERYDEKL